MRNNGLVVFVNRDVNHILDDLDLGIRPLCKRNYQYIFNVYEERYPLYMKKWHILKSVMKAKCYRCGTEIIEAPT